MGSWCAARLGIGLDGHGGPAHLPRLARHVRRQSLGVVDVLENDGGGRRHLARRLLVSREACKRGRQHVKFPRQERYTRVALSVSISRTSYGWKRGPRSLRHSGTVYVSCQAPLAKGTESGQKARRASGISSPGVAKLRGRFGVLPLPQKYVHDHENRKHCERDQGG